MNDADEFPLGPADWSIRIPAAKRLMPPVRAASSAQPADSIREALESPHGFEPLRRALTPDDRIAIVVDDKLPHLPTLLTGVLEHLSTAGIAPANVTLIVAPPGRNQGFIDDLPDEFADVTVEVHDPDNDKRLAYLATTTGGRRIYLNRSLVQADFMIVLTGRRFDPVIGVGGGLAAIFPALSNAATRAETAAAMPVRDPLAVAAPAEGAEIAWLLGTPFFVQVIEGPGGTIESVVAGLVDSLAESEHRQRDRWTWDATGRAPLAIVTASGELADLANALANAGRLLDGLGEIVLLAEPTAVADEAFLIVQNAGTPAAAAAALQAEKPAGLAAAMLWALAARIGKLRLGPDWSGADKLFASPIGRDELQRLVDTASSVAVLPDAHLLHVRVAT